MKNVLIASMISLLATGALAHSKTNATLPADGAKLTEMPDQISLTFAKKIRLTKVQMTHASDPAVTLDLGEQTSFGKEFSVPVEQQGDGVYQIEWRGLGGDGHPMQGMFTFQVD